MRRVNYLARWRICGKDTKKMLLWGWLQDKKLRIMCKTAFSAWLLHGRFHCMGEVAASIVLLCRPGVLRARCPGSGLGVWVGWVGVWNARRAWKVIAWYTEPSRWRVPGWNVMGWVCRIVVCYRHRTSFRRLCPAIQWDSFQASIVALLFVALLGVQQSSHLIF